MAKHWKRKPELLLCPRTPEPLHGLVPRNILGPAWWNKTRKESYESTNQHCEACGVHKSNAKSKKWLEGHELYDIDYQKGLSVYVRTVPLCHYCHNYIHCGRMWTLLNQGRLNHYKYSAILNHGDTVLSKVGLVKPSIEEQNRQLTLMRMNGEYADWKYWRLSLFGVEYPSLYKSEKDYIQYWKENA